MLLAIMKTKVNNRQAGQVYFDREDYMEIKMFAAQRGVSFAEFVRESTLSNLRKMKKNKNQGTLADLGTINIGKGKRVDIARNIDKYLY